MALFLLYKPVGVRRNANGVGAVLVEAATEGAAFAAAVAGAPDGETFFSQWVAVEVADEGSDGDITLPTNPIYFEGDAASLTRFRGQ
jgi:hypothetical protein